MLKINEKAPDFSLKDQEGKTVSLQDQKGKYVVLYFYPQDLTPGCTTQACFFRDFNEDIKKQGALILGIGGGDANSKQKFSQKHKLNFPILDDTDNQVAKTYDVYKPKKMFGKEFLGIQRVTYLIDPDGKIVFVWEKVKPAIHAKEVLDKIVELKQVS